MKGSRHFDTIGLRRLCPDESESYSIGSYCRNSYDWNIEYDCSSYDIAEYDIDEEPVELSGVCTIDTYIDLGFDDEDEIKEKLEIAAKKVYRYGSDCDTYAVICGDMPRGGNDEDEIIISNAFVVDFL
ncbi:hypothetical protein FYJ58_04795 [Lachnospiraceae bacterium WCA-693-APC-MOT-I]|uniref:Uncharacterized protein n=1 Tax=Velocimicrobium porci TaxID=2606634 RepID=A0A6L5XWJ1_9FIRM|nr:hypothetical protein [Velocimicrobium porci]